MEFYTVTLFEILHVTLPALRPSNETPSLFISLSAKVTQQAATTCCIRQINAAALWQISFTAEEKIPSSMQPGLILTARRCLMLHKVFPNLCILSTAKLYAAAWACSVNTPTLYTWKWELMTLQNTTWVPDYGPIKIACYICTFIVFSFLNLVGAAYIQVCSIVRKIR